MARKRKNSKAKQKRKADVTSVPADAEAQSDPMSDGDEAEARAETPLEVTATTAPEDDSPAEEPAGRKSAKKKPVVKKKAAEKKSAKKKPAEKTSAKKKSAAKKKPPKRKSAKKKAAENEPDVRGPEEGPPASKAKASARKSSLKKASTKKAPTKEKSPGKASAEKASAEKKPPKKTPSAETPPHSDEDVTTLDLDDDDATSDDVAALLAEAAALSDEDVASSAAPAEVDDEVLLLDGNDPTPAPLDDAEVIEIAVDDDFDDAADRDRLIAEALAFVEAEESGTHPDSSARSDSGAPDESASVNATARPDTQAGTAQSSGSDDVASDEEDDVPLLTSDALLALSEMREQGLGTLPSELVLDLGGATTPEDRDRLLAAALAHAEMQEAIYRVPVAVGAARRWKNMIAATLMLLAVLVAARPPGFVVPEPPAQLVEADRLRGVHITLFLQAQQIEAYRTREQRLPDSLAEVGATFPGIRFVKSGNRLFQLIAYAPDGSAVVFDSSAPAPVFQEISNAWVTTGDAP